MKVRTRLIFLALSLSILLIIGRIVTGDFAFVLTQFWFTSGFLLLLLLSLIDQPHFSKDANIFVNATTAWISLLLVAEPLRNGVWWGFFAWAVYLIVSSFLLMWARSRELDRESTLVQTVSRINRQIGRPDALFSAFFLWGCVLQFRERSGALSALFLYWAIFMILNLPALAALLDGVLSRSTIPENDAIGILDRLISPRIAEIGLVSGAPSDLIGRDAVLRTRSDAVAATGAMIDDRIVAGRRLGRIAITAFRDSWRSVGDLSKGPVSVYVSNVDSSGNNHPISVVDAGSTIASIVFYVHPDVKLQSGEVLVTSVNDATAVFFQVIAATVSHQPLADGNSMHVVRVTAGQLGEWNAGKCSFEPTSWVATAGQIIRRVHPSDTIHVLPPGNAPVGKIPHSEFPVHVAIEDMVTHNTALIGVTGSGKSYLAFHLIESMAARGIKVLILDISRQHDLFLGSHKPTALKATTDIATWLGGDSLIGIHQFAVDMEGCPRITADFVKAAFDEVSKVKLERGRNIPARLCIVLEEAHSLIPEWNQVANKGDERQVNRTARYILQGRKFGMGTLIVTQRTANVTKTILNQCNTIFALQSFDQTGLEFLSNYMGEEYSQAMSTLPVRHAILVGKASSSTRPLLLSVDDMTQRWTDKE